MSEIRRVAIKLKGEDIIIAACKAAGMETVKNKDRITVKNSGIRSYGTVSLVKQADGTYILEGDASQKELEELSNKLKAYHGEIIAIKTVEKNNFNLYERKIVDNKIKIKVRAFV